jgi:hypothetical protein
MAIIDGSGEWSNDTYRTSFTHSFCRQTADALGSARHPYFYNRGPSSAGLETGPYARRAINWLKQNHAERPREPVYLMGFSRGAAACVTVASFLRSEAPKLRITAMFLFDAVDRSIFTDAETVPGNVDVCHHIVRDYSWNTWWEGKHRHNRWYFNSDALEGERGVEMDIGGPVLGSHGAIGGTPWPDNARDPQAVITVANWMNSRLSRHRLPRALNAAHCYPEGSPMDRRVEGLLQPRPRPPSGLRPSASSGIQHRGAGR